MRKILLITLLNLPFVISFAQKAAVCDIQTSMGTIRIELCPEQAPVTVTNFLRYVDAGLYDGTSFYRVCTPENEKERMVQIQVIQGGDVAESKQFAPIRMETTQMTGLRHRNGTLSMARDTPNSATSSFFICIGYQPELDFTGKTKSRRAGLCCFRASGPGHESSHEDSGAKE